MIKTALPLDPVSYRRHSLHGDGRTWAETNCYFDLWIELLHTLGYEPTAVLPCTVAIDFEGDQWTFFKPPLGDLYDLYGFDVQELAIWRPLAAHVEEQVRRGRPVLVELDSYFLPDTAGSAYKRAHVKTTVAIVEIDVERRHMGYFHNQGYFHLDGDDFVDVLRQRTGPRPDILPPYAEFVKIRSQVSERIGASLVHRSLQLFRKHVTLIPAQNPFPKFKAQFESDLNWLLKEDLERFHEYSFAMFRQYGACFELAHTYLQWLISHDEPGLGGAVEGFQEISQGAKSFQFQLARAVSRRKPPELSPLDAAAASWERVAAILRDRYI